LRHAIPTNKKIVILGAAEGNIGEAIYDRLTEEYIGVTQYREDEMKLSEHLGFTWWGDFNTFIFNNGYTHLDWIEDQSHGEIYKVVNNCLTVTMAAVADLVKATINNKELKTIIFIGSMAHNHVLNGSAPYCAAKAGLNMFAKCIAYELAPKGYVVYCINPSNVTDAPMTEKTIEGLMRYRGMSLGDAIKYWSSECPMGEFLTKQEIAEVVATLLNPDMRYMSGCSIDLAGGGR
jgi:NAD(P)-dependent dehydrogenase (short-subunit alcohol dehydrogenase family)